MFLEACVVNVVSGEAVSLLKILFYGRVPDILCVGGILIYSFAD